MFSDVHSHHNYFSWERFSGNTREYLPGVASIMNFSEFWLILEMIIPRKLVAQICCDHMVIMNSTINGINSLYTFDVGDLIIGYVSENFSFRRCFRFRFMRVSCKTLAKMGML